MNDNAPLPPVPPARETVLAAVRACLAARARRTAAVTAESQAAYRVGKTATQVLDRCWTTAVEPADRDALVRVLAGPIPEFPPAPEGAQCFATDAGAGDVAHDLLADAAWHDATTAVANARTAIWDAVTESLKSL